jgi:hypothetical protein
MLPLPYKYCPLYVQLYSAYSWTNQSRSPAASHNGPRIIFGNEKKNSYPEQHNFDRSRQQRCVTDPHPNNINIYLGADFMKVYVWLNVA